MLILKIRGARRDAVELIALAPDVISAAASPTAAALQEYLIFPASCPAARVRFNDPCAEHGILGSLSRVFRSQMEIGRRLQPSHYLPPRSARGLQGLMLPRKTCSRSGFCMKIAVLALGSLVRDRRQLAIKEPFLPDGPRLPVEFSASRAMGGSHS